MASTAWCSDWVEMEEQKAVASIVGRAKVSFEDIADKQKEYLVITLSVARVAVTS